MCAFYCAVSEHRSATRTKKGITDALLLKPKFSHKEKAKAHHV